MTKSVTFTGHRYIPQSKRSDLCTKLEKAIMENHSKGVRNFLCGMAVGFDLLAAEDLLYSDVLLFRCKKLLCKKHGNMTQKAYKKNDPPI